MHRLLPLALLVLAACDSSTPSSEEGDIELSLLSQITVGETAELSPSAASSFGITLDQRGNAQSPAGIASGTRPSVLASSALWVSGMQGGSLRTAQTRGHSTYAPCGDGSGGVFHLFADTTYSTDGWPVAQGAPVDASGAPRAYGDEMLWTTTCQSPDNARGLTLFDGLRTNVAMFRYAATPNTVFARYEVVNTSAAPMTDVTVGLYSDPDFTDPLGGVFEDIYDNLVGLDAAREFGYVYFDQIKGPNGARRTDRERGHVAGVTLLETPRSLGLTGHRITNKAGVYAEPRAYTDLLYAHALQTLFNDGTPQVNWATGLADRFAFTGDPVAMTGWLDGTGPLRLTGTPQDVQNGTEARMLLSSGSFALAPGERATLTVAWVTAGEPSLGAALGALQQRVSSLRTESTLWRF